MTIYSLVAKRIEDGGWSGVCRFDAMLRRVFPDLRSITPACMPESFESGGVVIADNHLSLLVPENVKTIVVHHGCAETHFARDLYWRNESTRAIVEQQKAMFEKPNRKYVAPSQWIADQFWPDNKFTLIQVIPHWVERMELERKSAPPKPVIIGDWRDWNKGSEAWKRIAAYCPQWHFRPLAFRTENEKREQYRSADLFLNLSLSEGAGYAMADAEAAGIPIVTTDTGLWEEFKECFHIPWQLREDVEAVTYWIAKSLSVSRGPSFYDRYSFDDWAALWRKAIQ
jgi:glycosyltransferase involved in cell wall biosynthesis